MVVIFLLSIVFFLIIIVIIVYNLMIKDFKYSYYTMLYWKCINEYSELYNSIKLCYKYGSISKTVFKSKSKFLKLKLKESLRSLKHEYKKIR